MTGKPTAEKPPARPPDEIVHDIGTEREGLTAALGQLGDELGLAAQAARDRVDAAGRKARSLAPAAAAAAAALATGVLLFRGRRRRRERRARRQG